MLGVLVLLFAVSFSLSNADPKLVIDHDGGADDAMAIFLALLYEKYFDGPQVVALTTSHGNVDEPQVFENTQRILDIAQRRDVLIYRGSNYSLVTTYPTDSHFGKDGLGDLPKVEFEPTEAQSEHAAIALIELSRKYEGDLIVVAIGALTNIALAIRLDPNFITRVGHLFAEAGNVRSNTTKPQFNALMDVEGYYVLVQNSIPEKVTLVFTHFFQEYPMEWRKNVLGAIDTPIILAENKFERISTNNFEKSTWKSDDALAMALALNNSLVQKYECDNNNIILCGSERGFNTDDFTSTDCKNSNVKVAIPGPKSEFGDFLYIVFFADTKNSF